MPPTKNTQKISKTSETSNRSKTSAPTPPIATPTATTNSTTGQAPTPPATQAQTPTPTTASPVTGVAAGAGAKNAAKTDLQTSYVALIAGLQSFYQPTDVFLLDSGTETCAELIVELQAYVNAAETTKASNKAWRTDVQAEKQVLAEVAPKRAALFTALQSRFGKSGVQLLQFGFTPYKPRKVTAAALVGGQAKAKATREARGTSGKKQKLDVSGDVTGVTITPVTSAATSAAAPVAAAKPAGSAA
jgi:hypothetical protein